MNKKDGIRVSTEQKIQEETLDPEDWQAIRELGHRMLDDMLDYLKEVRERPVWQPAPQYVRQQFKQPLPLEPQAPERIYQQFRETALAYPMGNIHPRFWGWVMGTGTPTGMLAEMLAAGLNPNLGGGDHAAAWMESQVLDWCKEIMGFPLEAGGLLVSGGSMANLVDLTVARNTKAGFDIRTAGLENAPKPLRLYGSVEMHSSIQKAVELLGLGSQALRQIPVDDRYQIDIEAL
jgi:aromatic-L-amino-acid decarboxylase